MRSSDVKTEMARVRTVKGMAVYAHTFDQRVRNIHMLQGLGFEICSGGIIGMGESKEDVVDMLLELREIQPEALPINHAHKYPYGCRLHNRERSFGILSRNRSGGG